MKLYTPGFSLIEVLISLLIVSSVLLGTLAVINQSQILLRLSQQSVREQQLSAECYETQNNNKTSANCD